MASTAAFVVLTGLALVATLAPCSAQPFFKPTGTPGAYGTIDEVPPKWDLPSAMMKPTSTPGAYGTVVEDPPKWELPTWNFTMPTKAPKVMLPKLNMLPGLTFNGTGKHKVNLNATMLLNNLTQCTVLQNIFNRIPNLNGIMLVGECPLDETHLNCAQCQISFTMMYTSECIACNSPFTLDKTTKLCGCPIGYESYTDPASKQLTCIEQIYYGGGNAGQPVIQQG